MCSLVHYSYRDLWNVICGIKSRFPSSIHFCVAPINSALRSSTQSHVFEDIWVLYVLFTWRIFEFFCDTICLFQEDGSIDDSTEEKQLYMRFHIGLKDISAFLVDGNFDWRKHYNLDSATGRLHAANDTSLHQLRGSESREDRGDNKSGDFEGKEGGASDNVKEVDTNSNVSQTKGKAKREVDPGDGDLFFLPMLEKTGMTVALEQVSSLTLFNGYESCLLIIFPTHLHCLPHLILCLLMVR